MNETARNAVFPLIFVICISSCSWNASDRALFTSYLAFSALDAGQTYKASRIGAPELNPLLAKDDDTPDMNRVVLLKIFGATIIGLLLDVAHEDRRVLLEAANGLQGGVVAWNQYALWRIENENRGDASRVDGFFVNRGVEEEGIQPIILFPFRDGGDHRLSDGGGGVEP